MPRERFVPESERRFAYSDGPLSIGFGQTISQPYIVALMTELLRPHARMRVLEIGTGSGYQTAVLAECVGEVYTVEIVPELSRRAEELLRDLGYTNVRFRVGDGSLGWPEHAPFDRILVTAGAPDLPPPLFEQLAEGGLLVIPIGDRESQVLEVVTKRNGRALARRLVDCAFVPLLGKEGWAR